MPFKSKAQRRKFAELLVKGKISPETFEEWSRETGDAKLPERVDAPRRTAAKKKRPTAKKKRPAAKRKTAARRTAARKRGATGR
ncbi:MAG TPA: hypothetical protein VKH19_02820 [Gemmatimonadaceae bacterium]|nr:hypothetical protein [Gemmatimonadaceae bacterium]